MLDQAALTASFWRNLRNDRTVMLGLSAVSPVALQPMTVQLVGTDNEGPFWFFSTADSTLLSGLSRDDRAMFSYVSEGHRIFATVQGHLSVEADPSMVDQLWNPWVAAWYPEGRADPTLALLRFDPTMGEIWRDDASFFSGQQVQFGVAPLAHRNRQMSAARR